MKIRAFIALGVVGAAVACSSVNVAKEEVSAEATSEALTSVTNLGTITSGQSKTFKYTSNPTYRAYSFTAKANDKATVDVKSTDGDAVTWIIDSKDKVIGFNDDASNNTFNSHIEATITAAGTYRIVVREYAYWKATFTASLTIKSPAPVDMYACNVDADCAKVQKGCCDYLGNVAVNTASVDAYKATLGCSTPQICPKIAVLADYSAALCNTSTKKCELVKPADIACGGRTLNPHSCPSNYLCMGDTQMVDATGKCMQQCGGFAGFQCNEGTTCVDNWTDSCDPNKGGADCGGVCHSCGDVKFKCASGYHVDWANCTCSRDFQ